MCYGKATAFLVMLLFSNPARANEVLTYTYDALGQLVEQAAAGSGDNSGLDLKFALDLTGNRQVYTVTGSKGRGQQIMVLPLTGFKLVPINP